MVDWGSRSNMDFNWPVDCQLVDLLAGRLRWDIDPDQTIGTWLKISPVDY